MQKLITIFLSCLIVSNIIGQNKKSTSGYLLAQYNQTIRDRTKGNNPWGMGLGFQLFFNNHSRIRPTIDITADAYLEDDKVYRLNADGTAPIDVRSMLNLFAGVSYKITQTTYLSFAGGPTFISGETFIGIKPSFGFYFSKNQSWTGKISCINIFNRDFLTKEDFSSISFSIGKKLF